MLFCSFFLQAKSFAFFFFIMHMEDKSARNPILIGQSHCMNTCLEAELSVTAILIITWPLRLRIIKTVRVTDFFLVIILTEHHYNFHSEVLQNHNIQTTLNYRVILTGHNI